MLMLFLFPLHASAQTNYYADPMAGDLLYADDFSDTSSGWSRIATAGYKMDYIDGMYHIYVNTSNTVKNARLPTEKMFNDFIVETTVYLVDVPEDGEYGLNLRRDTENNYYRLIVSNNKKFAFYKYKQGKWTALIPWTESDAIEGGSNKLKVIASGENFTIYINDRWVGSCTDKDIRSGVIDILAETVDTSNIHVAFDGISVWSIKDLAGVPSGEILTVGEGKRYSKIQDAINASAEGSTIEIYPGTYRENVLVDKSVRIRGVGTPVLDAARRGDGIVIRADGVIVEGISVINARGGGLFGSTGINVYSSGNQIRNNTIRLCDDGISLYESSNNIIEGNIIEENDGKGIYLLSECNDNIIQKNKISENADDGIHIYTSFRNQISGNVLRDNLYYNAYDDFNATEYGSEDANMWDDGAKGNYYSDLACLDSNSDGICDSSYRIPGGDSVDRYPLASPEVQVDVSGRVPETNASARSGSALISSGQAGSISLDGAMVDIPPGSVPLKEDGTVGEVVISIEKTDLRPELGEGFDSVGDVYQLGPEGLIFERPVELTFKIPEGVDPNTVIGVTTFNATTGRWELIPGSVDPDARTVTVFTDHFSPYALVRSPEDWMRRNGGWIEVINRHVYNTDAYTPCQGEDRCKRLPTHTEHGICIQGVVFDNPSLASSSWTPPTDWLILAHDVRAGSSSSETKIRYWVPAGSYRLVEFLFVSEVNPGDPMYVPCSHARAKAPMVYKVNPGDTLRFDHISEAGLSEAQCFVGGYPCRSATAAAAGKGTTTVVHTGDVQVTLTWHAHADIDLYVEDPNGDVVWYGNTQISSGGQLDRDNMCSNFEMGRPENIFWEKGKAPAGLYKVRVNYYADCGDAGPVRWTVRTVVGGNVKTYTGVLNEVGDTQEVTTFEI